MHAKIAWIQFISLKIKLYVCVYVRISRMIRIISDTGGAHAVDSSDIAFRMAAIGAMRQGKFKASTQDYPVWNLKMTTPDNTSYQGVRCFS